jgi:hypothetical protein
MRNLNTYTNKTIKNDEGRSASKFMKSSLAKLYLTYGKGIARFFSFKEYAPFFFRAMRLSPSIKNLGWFIFTILGWTDKIEAFLVNRKSS